MANRQPRILVVDDEPSIRRLMPRLLPKYAITAVDGGRAAQELLDQDADFDLILCDLTMPGVSGPELSSWVTEHRPQLAERMLFVTGGAVAPDVRKFMDGLGDRCLHKPFNPSVLRATVAAHLAEGR